MVSMVTDEKAKAIALSKALGMIDKCPIPAENKAIIKAMVEKIVTKEIEKIDEKNDRP